MAKNSRSQEMSPCSDEPEAHKIFIHPGSLQENELYLVAHQGLQNAGSTISNKSGKHMQLHCPDLPSFFTLKDEIVHRRQAFKLKRGNKIVGG